MYQQAVNYKPNSFFYINTNAKDVANMFYINFEQVFQIDTEKPLKWKLI